MSCIGGILVRYLVVKHIGAHLGHIPEKKKCFLMMIRIIISFYIFGNT